jgi:hypothetical protein
MRSGVSLMRTVVLRWPIAWRYNVALASLTASTLQGTGTAARSEQRVSRV